MCFRWLIILHVISTVSCVSLVFNSSDFQKWRKIPLQRASEYMIRATSTLCLQIKFISFCDFAIFQMKNNSKERQSFSCDVNFYQCVLQSETDITFSFNISSCDKKTVVEAIDNSNESCKNTPPCLHRLNKAIPNHCSQQNSITDETTQGPSTELSTRTSYSLSMHRSAPTSTVRHDITGPMSSATRVTLKEIQNTLSILYTLNNISFTTTNLTRTTTEKYQNNNFNIQVNNHSQRKKISDSDMDIALAVTVTVACLAVFFMLFLIGRLLYRTRPRQKKDGAPASLDMMQTQDFILDAHSSVLNPSYIHIQKISESNTDDSPVSSPVAEVDTYWESNPGPRMNYRYDDSDMSTFTGRKEETPKRYHHSKHFTYKTSNA